MLLFIKTGQRRDVRANVSTFSRVLFEMTRRWNQRRDVAERLTFQRRDVESERCDVPERYIFKVATFPRGIYITSRRSQDAFFSTL